MTFVPSTQSPRKVLDAVTTTTKKPPPSLDDNDTITSLPPIPDFHPLFNKRHIFPLTLSPTFDWFFDTLPADFKQRYRSCVESSTTTTTTSHDLEALDAFFWEASGIIDRSRSHFTVIYHVTLQASVFDSFVEEMETFCTTTTRNGAFVLPITRICGDLMEWGRRYNLDTFPNEDVNETFHCYHRHFFVAAQHGFHFIDHCIDRIRRPYYVRGGTFPVPLLLKLKAFNSVAPVTRLTDLLKVCSIRQFYDCDDDDDSVDTDTGNYIMKRFNMPPVHRDDSF